MRKNNVLLQLSNYIRYPSCAGRCQPDNQLYGQQPFLLPVGQDKPTLNRPFQTLENREE